MKKFRISLIASIILAIVVGYFDVSTGINILIISTILHSFSYLFIIFEEERKVKEIDKHFPIFLKNLSRNIGAKVPVIKALIETSKQKYGNLSPIFHSFARKLEVGINPKKAFEYLINLFKENIKIRNGLVILKEAFLTGYGLKETIEGVFDYIVKITTMENERKSILSQYIILFYAISIIFVVITLIIIKVMVPIYSSFVENMEKQGQFVEIPCEFAYGFQSIICSIYENEMKLFKKEYKTAEYYLFGVLFNAIIIQSLFAGIIIGIGIERSLVKGLIHSLTLFSITFFIFLVVGKIGLI
jgi:archaellum biogenesis protein FlaJ (TadC family)